jgi:hypothetical protein
MKTLLNTSTGQLVPYPRNDDEDVVGLDSMFQILTVHQAEPPAFDIATQQLERTEVIDKATGTVARGWKVVTIPPAPAPIPRTPADVLASLGLTLNDLKQLVALTSAAAWDKAVAYTIGQSVTHNGKTWVATSDNTGNEPDDVPGDWAKVGE